MVKFKKKRYEEWTQEDDMWQYQNWSHLSLSLWYYEMIEKDNHIEKESTNFERTEAYPLGTNVYVFIADII